MSECRICGNDNPNSAEIDRCRECLVICPECGEKPINRFKLMKLEKNGKVIAEVPTRVCDDCSFENAAWSVVIGTLGRWALTESEGDDEENA